MPKTYASIGYYRKMVTNIKMGGGSKTDKNLQNKMYPKGEIEK